MRFPTTGRTAATPASFISPSPALRSSGIFATGEDGMVTMHGKFLGGKNVEIQHGPSGATIRTTAPKDNNGEGNLFSPTDLVAAALGSCILTTMVIVAERDNTDLTGAYFEIQKHMATDPRRIGALPIVVHLPKALNEMQRKKMEHCAHACPVHRSLHPEMQKEISFCYDV